MYSIQTDREVLLQKQEDVTVMESSNWWMYLHGSLQVKPF